MARAGRKLAVAVLVLFVLLVPAAARAAQYTVHACGTGSNNSFFGAASDSRMAARSLCAADADGHRLGVAVLAGVNQGQVPVFANASQTFLAPPGTTISHVHLKGDARTSNGDWAALLQASNDGFSSGFWNVAGCSPRAGDTAGCNAAMPHADQNYDLPGATGFRSIVACGNFAGCGTLSTGTWPFSRAYYLIHQADVTLEDRSAPGVTVTGGGLAAAGWLRGPQSVVYEAADNSGISKTQLVVDDTVFDHIERQCDYAFAVPCANVNDLTYLLDTSRVADGPHRITIAAYDATDANRGTAARTVLIDNHAPAEPVGAAVAGGEGWRTNDDFTVTWTNPASAAPITRALYEICRVGGSCTSGDQSGDGISQLTGLHVGQPGDYTIRVWLSDAAGNVSDAKSAPLHLKFDNVPPGQAAPQRRNGWLNDVEARQFVLEVGPPLVAAPPISGIAAYTVTVDGSIPPTDAARDAIPADPKSFIARKQLEGLPEGTTAVQARAISGAGVASADVGTTELHVDRAAPRLEIAGSPDETGWSRDRVVVHATASEPEHRSGMASPHTTSDEHPGGFIEYRIDDGGWRRITGPEGDFDSAGLLGYVPSAASDIPVDADGSHTVSVRAADAAGNLSTERTTKFNIDRTAPELAVFEAQEASDPARVSVAASDRTSGLADGGQVRFRRIRPSVGPWVVLRAARDGDHYYAHLNNATLIEGDYEFRAVVPDQAGNEATASTDRAGHDEVLHISPTRIGPYPTTGGEPTANLGGIGTQDTGATVDTRLRAHAVNRVVRRRKCKRSRRHRKRCVRVTTTEQLVNDLRVPFGGKTRIRGTLTTRAGAALTGAEVTVLARPFMAGGEYRAEAVVSTNRAGAFTYRAPAGPGRALYFLYRGDRVHRHADDQVTLRVAARATIAVNRHAVRNGQHVWFSGRLLGRPFPSKGKLLTLQAYYRRKWRTFATPRSGRRGAWRIRYQFQATRGTVVYRFRIRVPATSDYPYELGYSRVTRVRVNGR